MNRRCAGNRAGVVVVPGRHHDAAGEVHRVGGLGIVHGLIVRRRGAVEPPLTVVLAAAHAE